MTPHPLHWFRRRSTRRAVIDLAHHVEALQAQVDELTHMIEHPTWPEPYRRRRAAEAVDRLTQR